MKITPELVVEAYKNTGIRPIWASFVEADGTCGCALTALYVNQVGKENPFETAKSLVKQEKDVLKVISETLDLPSDLELTSFYLGFDYPDKTWVDDPHIESVKLGQETRRLVDKEVRRVVCYNEALSEYHQKEQDKEIMTYE